MIWGWIIAAVASIAGSAYYQKKMAEDMAESQSGLFVNKASASEGLRIIYGRRRVGAIKAWKGVTKNGAKLTNTTGYDKLVNQTSKDNSHGGTRDGNDWLHRLDVWGQGPIDSIETFHIDGDEHTNSRFTGRSHPMFRSVSYYGSETQTAPANLVSVHPEITSSMRGKGVAYSWNRFLYRDTDIQYQGEPNVTATVKGMKVWDPRTNPTNSAIKSWSNNPALCLLDYLMADYGKGLSESDLDIETFKTAANSCDTTVTIPGVTTNTTGSTIFDYYDAATGELIDVLAGDNLPNQRTYQTGTSQVRFQCDIVLSPKDKTSTNVEKILKTMKGTLPFSQGQYKLILEDTASSVMSFDDDNTLGNLNITFADRSKRLNRVTIKFPNRNKDFEDDMLSWPDKSSLQYSNYFAEDQSEDLHTEIKLEGVTDFFQAQDLAEFIVKDSRTQMFIEFKAQPAAMTLEAGDVIQVTHDSPNWTNKEFRVRDITINSDLTVNIKAQEYDSNIFQWGVKDAEPTVAYEYINPFRTPAAVTNFTATSLVNTKADGTKISGIRATWDNISSDTNSVDRIFVGYKLTTDTEYTYSILPRGDISKDIIGLNDNTAYNVSIYYRDIVGKQSDPVTLTISLAALTTVIDTIGTDISDVEQDAANAQAAADQAAADALAAQQDADQAIADALAAQNAADAAQSDADTNTTDVAQALADAAGALSAANNAQNTADLKQTSAEVLAAIAADTTVIDGARITTGTVNAARISIAGKNISDLVNDSGFTDDTLATAAAASAATAASNASLAQSAADAAQNDADTAQAAADAAQSDANSNATDVANAQADATQALSDAASAASAASNAQSTANAKQTAAEVLAAIAADTTVIDGARITTGTIDAARISLTGKNISDLNNDSGFTNDSVANTAVSNAATAAGAAATAASAAATAQAAADAAQADANTNATDVATAQAAADAAQAAADAAAVTANAAQTSAEVQTAIANDTTVIDGARITTGTVAAGRIDIAGKNISDLNNNSGFTNDTTANAALAAAVAAQGTADAAQTAGEVLTAIQNDTTVIDGSRITTGTVNSGRIDTDTLAVKKFADVSTKIIDHDGNEVPLRVNDSAFHRNGTTFTTQEQSTGSFCPITIPNVRDGATYTTTFTGVLGNNTGIYIEYSTNGGANYIQAANGIQNITMSTGTFRSYTFMYIGQVSMPAGQSSIMWRVRFQTLHRSTYLSLYVDMDNTT